MVFTQAFCHTYVKNLKGLAHPSFYRQSPFMNYSPPPPPLTPKPPHEITPPPPPPAPSFLQTNLEPFLPRFFKNLNPHINKESL